MDLDGTLAECNGWSADGSVGAPIPEMVRRVKDWIAAGEIVKIFTGRVSPNNRTDKDLLALEEYRGLVQDWCEKHLGKRLDVTHEKDPAMIQLWDDRCVHVETNTGEILG